MRPENIDVKSNGSVPKRPLWHRFRWLIGFGLPLVIMLAIRPQPENNFLLLLVNLFYVFLGFGFVVALVVAVFIAAEDLWTAWSQSSVLWAWVSPYLHYYFGISLLFGVTAFSAYWLFQGVFNGEVLYISRRTHVVVSHASNPFEFLLAMWCWGALFCIMFFALLTRKKFKAT